MSISFLFYKLRIKIRKQSMNSRDYRVLSDKNVETFILRGFTIIMLFECIVTLINTIIQWSQYGLVGRSCFCES